MTLLLTWNDKPAERHVIAASIWQELTALDAAVYASETYRKGPERFRRLPWRHGQLRGECRRAGAYGGRRAMFSTARILQSGKARRHQAVHASGGEDAE
ncbi:hypothetical protein [Sphingomonas sp. SAFR-052]|uniref:hypothetical protein n=1 Tax=Sphingomonas sp. SAFR-052 TaxID=3436867 RepID=UPI003F815C1C